MIKPKWESKIKCKFCGHKFSITVDKVEYADLRPDFFFVPDMQYKVVCPQSGENLVLSNLPTEVTQWVQLSQNND